MIAAHDALYASTLRDLVHLPGVDRDDVDARLASIESAFAALWDDDRRIYVDTPDAEDGVRQMSQHTNALALAAGLVPDERVGAVIARITDPTPFGGRLVRPGSPSDDVMEWQRGRPLDFDPDVDVLATQPFMGRFLHQALFRHDRRDLILESLLRWADPDWMWSENGTFSEHWGLGGDTCHGWSSTPTYDLTTYVLGLSPAEPGWRRARLAPFLGPMDRVAGTVPTPMGWLSARIDRTSVELSVPAGIDVLVGSDVVGAGEHHVATELEGL